MQYLGEILRRNRRRVIGIGSPRASLEANFALRTLVGPERFFAGLSERDNGLMATAVKLLRESPARTPSLQDVALADAALVLGEDVPNVAPMLAFALRQVILQVRDPKRRDAGHPAVGRYRRTRLGRALLGGAHRESAAVHRRSHRDSPPRHRRARLSRFAGRRGTVGIRRRARDHIQVRLRFRTYRRKSSRWPAKSPARSCARSGRWSSPVRVAAARR